MPLLASLPPRSSPLFAALCPAVTSLRSHCHLAGLLLDFATAHHFHVSCPSLPHPVRRCDRRFRLSCRRWRPRRVAYCGSTSTLLRQSLR
eukprot:7495-Chlamydomonas_euryale.AAC.2